MRWAFMLACLVPLVACTAPAPPQLTPPGALEKLSAGPADARIRYGQEPGQFGDLRLPRRKGVHPVAILIHGGCWKAEYASLRDLAALADALTKAGIATWNIEYRRVGEPGGGWPGTYRDVGAAIDQLRSLARPHRLDLSRVVVVGHSAGGHLAHWAAARRRLSPSSALYDPDPLPLRGIVNMAGRMDMAQGIAAYESLCRDSVVTKLLGGAPDEVPDRYRDSSPMQLLPLGVPQIYIAGDHEEFVPAPLAQAYATAARKAGDRVELITIPAAGHFEPADPNSAAWPAVLGAVRRLLGPGS